MTCRACASQQTSSIPLRCGAYAHAATHLFALRKPRWLSRGVRRPTSDVPPLPIASASNTSRLASSRNLPSGLLAPRRQGAADAFCAILYRILCACPGTGVRCTPWRQPPPTILPREHLLDILHLDSADLQESARMALYVPHARVTKRAGLSGLPPTTQLALRYNIMAYCLTTARGCAQTPAARGMNTTPCRALRTIHKGASSATCFCFCVQRWRRRVAVANRPPMKTGGGQLTPILLSLDAWMAFIGITPTTPAGRRTG